MHRIIWWHCQRYTNSVQARWNMAPDLGNITRCATADAAASMTHYQEKSEFQVCLIQQKHEDQDDRTIFDGDPQASRMHLHVTPRAPPNAHWPCLQPLTVVFYVQSISLFIILSLFVNMCNICSVCMWSNASTRPDLKTLAAGTSVILCGDVRVVTVLGAESAVLEQHLYQSRSTVLLELEVVLPASTSNIGRRRLFRASRCCVAIMAGHAVAALSVNAIIFIYTYID